jgi:hypothetical protein
MTEITPQPAPPPTIKAEDLEKYRAELQVWVEQNKINLQHNHRMAFAQMEFSAGAGGAAVMQFALTGLRTLVIANGGAAIALLAFAGNSLGHNCSVGKFGVGLAQPMLCFSLGIITTLLAALFSFLAQVAFNEMKWADKQRRIAGGLRIGAIVSALISAGLFVGGSLIAMNALATL